MTATDTLTAPAKDGLQARLEQLLGGGNVLTSPEDLEFYSTDIYRPQKIAELVIRPNTPEEAAEAIGICTAHGRPVVPRGGGMSYTNGYTPAREHSVIVDLRGLDKIVEVNADDMYVTVEAGVTWQQLYEALKPKGLRTPYFGTASGYSSTVGGAMSQHSSHFASAQYGLSADSCLGLEVAIADGTIVKTGSGSNKNRPSPFFRYYGPDLTGLFLGDTGALGFKLRITMKLIPFPEHQGFRSFAFDTHEAMLPAMQEIGRSGLAAECGGWDPTQVANFISRSPDLKDDLKYLASVARSGSSLLDGLKGAARIALTGRRAFKDVSYLMNVTVDEFSAPALAEKLKAIDAIAARHGGRQAEATFPRAHRAIPFTYPNGILGIRGHRWSPTHGLAPHSRAMEVSHALFSYLAGRPEIEKYGIEWCLLMSEIGSGATLVEPMFYWPDKRSIFHERWIDKDYLANVPEFPDSPEVREAMYDVRKGVMNLFMMHGCTHFQVGKVYPYKEGRDEATYALLKGIKAVVDPKGLLNPGALGLE